MANEIQELKFQVGEAWKGVYSSSTAYSLANVVQDPTGLSVYRSLKPGNAGHPLSDTSWWFCIIDLSTIKAESGRIAALNQAIAQDEALRVAAEELRQQHEAERVAAETQRNEAEQARISAEQARVNAESARATAEQQRITAEQGRVSAESARVQAEQARVLAETLRANAEDQRAANEQNRVAAEQQRIERAEQDHQRAESDHAAYIDSLGAFDISSYHATDGVLAKYADLTAALGTNGANIPDDLRKGGMSVKFVQSSDNKYIQARCMAQNFTTDVTQWQGVDDEPTAGSDNLVKSGGVAKTYGVKASKSATGANSNIQCKINVDIVANTAVHIESTTNGGFSYYIRIHYVGDMSSTVLWNSTGDYVSDIVAERAADYIEAVKFSDSSVNDKTIELSIKTGVFTEPYALNALKEYAEQYTDGKVREQEIKNGLVLYDEDIAVTSTTVNKTIECDLPSGCTIRSDVSSTGSYSYYVRYYRDDTNYIQREYSSGQHSEDIGFETPIKKIVIITYMAVPNTTISAKFETVGYTIRINELEQKVNANTKYAKDNITALFAENSAISYDVVITENVNFKYDIIGNFKAGAKIQVRLSDTINGVSLSSRDADGELVESLISFGNQKVLSFELTEDANILRFTILSPSYTKNVTITLCNVPYDGRFVEKKNSSNLYNPYKVEKDKYINASTGAIASAFTTGSYEVTDYIAVSNIERLSAEGCRLDEGAATYAVYDEGYNLIRFVLNESNYIKRDKEYYVRYCMITYAQKHIISAGYPVASHQEEYTEHYYILERMYRLYAKPCVSLIDDDFTYFADRIYEGHTGIEQKEAFKAALLNAGLTCDEAASYNQLYTDAVREVALQWEKEGFQFIFHPTHEYWFPLPNVPVDYAIVRQRLVEDIVLTRTHFPSRHRVFVYPGNSQQYGATELAKEYFDCAVTWENGANSNKPYPDEGGRFLIRRFNLQIGVKGTQTMTQMKASIDQAAADNAWIIFGMHSHWLDLDGTEPTNPEKFTIANMMEIIQYALTATGTNKLVHVEEEWERRKPLFDYMGI